jgi:hypothetical protein
MTTPLPCPFCGKPPTVGPDEIKGECDFFAFVACENPECPAQPRVEDGEEVTEDSGLEKYKEAAIARWNKRS